MQKKLCFCASIFFVCFIVSPLLPAYSNIISDTTAVDSIKTPQPDFSNVNVIVETAWGTPDKSVNVNVYIMRKGKNISEIVLKKGQHQECSIELMEGIVVKIIDPKSGRILKQYGKME